MKTKLIISALFFFLLALSGCFNDGSDSASENTETPENNETQQPNAPISNAGPDQNLTTGTVVTLDGSASYDVDGDALSYHWSLASLPGGSAATLSNANSVSPTFTADVDGIYVAQLIVNDGVDDSLPDTSSIVASSANSAPVASAGPDQNVPTGAVVTLNASASSDADGDSLIYYWSLTSTPDTSEVKLSDPNSISPTFTADVDGIYVAQLIVSDGVDDSLPDTSKIVASTANSVPQANAGPDQSLSTGSVVILDGSGSSDIDGDTLSFRWSLISMPDGSTATLSDPSAVSPTFTADLDGTYVSQLIVNDGTVDSLPDTITTVASFTNSTPVANAGPDQTVLVTTEVNLNGNGSFDADGDGLLYNWKFVFKPEGSAAVLDNHQISNPSFNADLKGIYVISLLVNDGLVDSAVDSVRIDAIEPGLKAFIRSFANSNYYEVEMPYSGREGNVGTNVNAETPTSVHAASIKLFALGSSFTIVNLAATDLNSSHLTPYFDGISEGYQLADGEEVEFTLYAQVLNGVTSFPEFTFEVLETGETFSLRRQIASWNP